MGRERGHEDGGMRTGTWGRGMRMGTWGRGTRMSSSGVISAVDRMHDSMACMIVPRPLGQMWETTRSLAHLTPSPTLLLLLLLFPRHQCSPSLGDKNTFGLNTFLLGQRTTSWHKYLIYHLYTQRGPKSDREPLRRHIEPTVRVHTHDESLLGRNRRQDLDRKACASRRETEV